MSATCRMFAVLVTILSLAALPALEATAQAPQPPHVLGYKIPKPYLLKPDLAVRIEAFFKQGGAAIPNGGTANYGGGVVVIPVRVTVKNRGPGVVTLPTQTKITITRGGTAIADTSVTETAPLASGAVRVHDYTVNCPAITNKIAATATVDAGAAVAETSEANNSASYNCVVNVVH